MTIKNTFLNKIRYEIISYDIHLACCKYAFTLGISKNFNSSMAKIQIPKVLLTKPNVVFEKLPFEVKNNLIIKKTSSNIIKAYFPQSIRKFYSQNFKNNVLPTLNRNTIAYMHCIKAYLQGLFLGFGYTQDISKFYHLEFNLHSKFHYLVFKKINKCLKLGFKFIRRSNVIIGYLKSAEKIMKFLSVIEAYDSIMYLKDLIETKKITNSVNRKVNYETSNIKKSINASTNQIEKINKILEQIKLDELPSALQQIIHMRLKYPYDSLEQLAKRFSPPISKSAVNHRLRRINDLYNKIFMQKLQNLETNPKK